VVFKLDPLRKETVLYAFTDGADGAFPYAGLVRDAAGNLYGTAAFGGIFNSACQYGCGVVFKIDDTGQYSVLYSFTGGSDGAQPFAGLLLDSAGNLYGTASRGGPGYGVVFEIDTTAKYTVLYRFLDPTQGATPSLALRDGTGNFYGTTYEGGDLSCFSGNGCGTVFKLDPVGNLTVLHTFTGEPDGAFPNDDGLFRDKAGNLYGTTQNGGGSCPVREPPGCGTVFKLDPAGNESVLYAFTGLHGDGRDPHAVVIGDALGNLYGTTLQPLGTVFKLDSSGNETVLHRFSGGDGQSPTGRLLGDKKGHLYGTALGGDGVVFEVIP
jgi:uncharacterized repeat protein (TIGR03803 family)